MINPDYLENIQKATIAERIQALELILQSLKNDIKNNAKPPSSTARKQFRVRKFDLGEDIHVNREIIYADRGV